MPLPPEIIEERKNSLVTSLSEQYSRGQFTLEEYERLVEYAQKIETSRETALLGRLLRFSDEPEEPHSGQNGGGAYRPGPAGFPRGFQGKQFAVLASRRIENLPAAEEDRDFLSILGDCQVWVRETDLVDEVTLINANTLLGEVVIHVPDGVAVENRVIPVLGDAGVKKKKRGQLPDSPWSKKIIVSGTAILGNITVKYGK